MYLCPKQQTSVHTTLQHRQVWHFGMNTDLSLLANKIVLGDVGGKNTALTRLASIGGMSSSPPLAYIVCPLLDMTITMLRTFTGRWGMYVTKPRFEQSHIRENV